MVELQAVAVQAATGTNLLHQWPVSNSHNKTDYQMDPPVHNNNTNNPNNNGLDITSKCRHGSNQVNLRKPSRQEDRRRDKGNNGTKVDRVINASNRGACTIILNCCFFTEVVVICQ